MTKSWLAAAAFSLVLGSAAADAPPSPCDDSDCIWHRAGAPSLESIAAHGSEAIRFVGGFALSPHMSVMIELRRDAKGVVTATIGDLDRPAHVIARPAPAGLWRRFVALQPVLVAADARAKRILAQAKRGGSMIVCTDGSGLSVDSALRGRIVHLDTDSCENPSVDAALKHLYQEVYALDPDCLKIDKYYRDFCASLGGDRALAARAMRNVMDFTAICYEPAEAVVNALIAPDAVLDTAGAPKRSLIGALLELCPRAPDLQIDWIEAHDGDIVATGRFSLAEPGIKPEVFHAAPSVQHWRMVNGKAMLMSWSVGVFAATRP